MIIKDCIKQLKNIGNCDEEGQLKCGDDAALAHLVKLFTVEKLGRLHKRMLRRSEHYKGFKEIKQLADIVKKKIRQALQDLALLKEWLEGTHQLPAKRSSSTQLDAALQHVLDAMEAFDIVGNSKRLQDLKAPENDVVVDCWRLVLEVAIRVGHISDPSFVYWWDGWSHCLDTYEASEYDFQTDQTIRETQVLDAGLPNLLADPERIPASYLAGETGANPKFKFVRDASGSGPSMYKNGYYETEY